MTWPFGGSSDDEGDTEEEDEQVEETEEESEDDIVRVVAEATLEYDYTEHVATARYTSGREREWRFDVMRKTEHGIVLKNYVDENAYSHSMIRGWRGVFDPPYMEPAGAEAFVTIPWSNLEDFETTDRIQRTRTERWTETDTGPREDAERVMDIMGSKLNEMRIEEVEDQ